MAKRQTDSTSVDLYIARCPACAQPGLRGLRSVIRAAAPDSTERTDYFDMPGYSLPGYDYDGMFAWFSYKKPCVRLHVRPAAIRAHRHELGDFSTTKAIVSFPETEPLPKNMVKKLVKASIAAMKLGST